MTAASSADAPSTSYFNFLVVLLTTIRWPVFCCTPSMSTPSRTPVPIVTAIAAFFDTQDGSVPLTQLTPAIVLYVNRRTQLQQTGESVESIIRRGQDHTRSVHATEAAMEAAEKKHKELMEEAKLFKKGSARYVTWDRRHAEDIAAYDNSVKITRDPFINAEEKVLIPFVKMHERRELNNKQKKEDESKAKEEKNRKREEERKARDETITKEKEEKKAADEQKKEAELELKQKRLSVLADQSLSLKLKAAESELQHQAAALRKKEMDELTITSLKMYIEERNASKRIKLQNSEVAGEEDGDKENVNPADE